MACDIRGLITDALAIRQAVADKDIKAGWRAAIDAQDKGWTCAYGDGGIGILKATDEEEKEFRAAAEGVLADVTEIESGPRAAAWGDGRFLEFLKFLIPILIGLLPR